MRVTARRVVVNLVLAVIFIAVAILGMALSGCGNNNGENIARFARQFKIAQECRQTVPVNSWPCEP